jgi:hypothetical protein
LVFVVVHTNSRVQYEDYELRLKATRNKVKAIIARIAPVLDFIDRNLTLPSMGYLDVNPHPPNSFVDRCKGVLTNFKAYIHGVACTIAGHALAVVRSLYPAVSLEVIDGGFAEGAEDAEVG